nr:MAG TPA: hypothetical protein [Bacteriophage sp.]
MQHQKLQFLLRIRILHTISLSVIIPTKRSYKLI